MRSSQCRLEAVSEILGIAKNSRFSLQSVVPAKQSMTSHTFPEQLSERVYKVYDNE